jgi:hypothetical protein
MVCAGLAVAMCLATAGCGSWRWPGLGKDRAKKDGFEVVARNNRYSLTIAPSATDIVNMMLRIGFSEQQVIDLGEPLRNALTSSGAADIRRGKEVGVIFAVNQGDAIFITTRRGGTYIYDVRAGRFRLGEETQPPQPAPRSGAGAQSQ